MKRIIVVSIVALVFLLAFVPISKADMAKEGSGNYRVGKSGTFEVMMLGKDRLQMNYDEAGTFVEAPKNSPIENASLRIIGTLHAVSKKFTGSGAMLITCPNGDQIFGTYQNEGVLGVGPTGGFVKLVGGTGACTGIEGKLEIMPRPAVKSSKKGTYQGIGIGKITWKIP
jgi:hypothetical protein